MRNTSHDYERQGLRKQIDQERKQSIRSVYSRARRLESNVDWPQLPSKSSELLVNADGDFYFIFGHSLVGGPDVVGP